MSDMDALVIACGKSDVVSYSKTATLQEWLFGIDLTECLFVLLEKEMVVMASKKKIDYLRPITDAVNRPVVFYLKEKSSEGQSFDKVIHHIKSSRKGVVIGTFVKDRYEGEFFETWTNHIQKHSFEKRDLSPAISQLLSTKEIEEVKNIQIAASISCNIFDKYIKSRLLRLIEDNKEVKHLELAEKIEECTDNAVYYPKGESVSTEDVEVAFPVVIQSGGEFSLKFTSKSNSSNLNYDIIVIMMGVRYKYYCSTLVRTVLINPSQEQQDNYKLLYDAFGAALKELIPGNRMCEVYRVVCEFFNKNSSALANHLPQNIGFSTGIEFRDSLLLLDNKNDKIIESGMTFILMVSLSGLPSKNNTTYALAIGDTVCVRENGVSGESLTAATKKQLVNVCIRVDESSGDEQHESESPSEEERPTRKMRRLRESRGGERTTRGSKVLPKRDVTESVDFRRKAHQMELSKKMNEAARKRYLKIESQKKGSDATNKENTSTGQQLACYRSMNEFPKERDVVDLRIYVDKTHDCVILPVLGWAVPFHISTIKNVNTSLESDYMYLRFNFVVPIPCKNWVPDDDCSSNHAYGALKELIFRSLNVKEIGKALPDSAHLVNVFRQVKELQKKFKTQQAEEKEMLGIVHQDDLVLSFNKNMPRLRNLFVRPVVGNKRVSGTLEVHTNGFRFCTSKNDRVDILFTNVKFSFYQPCDGELVVLIHFRLKHPILLGKKKIIDIQFYTEVGSIVADLDKSSHLQHHDPDEIEAEEREKEAVQRLNTMFKHFCEAVETLTDGRIEFDSPFRDLGFNGVPSRVSILLTPTTHCLVNLLEMPFFVLTLDEIELVHFERVQINTKHFDMVFVFKDYSKKVVSISCIPMFSLDPVKEWLDSCDIKYSEGIQSLNWPKIMKTVHDDPTGFFESGGWSFLDPASDVEDANSQTAASESESADDVYNPCSSSFEESSSDENYGSSDVTNESSNSTEEEPSDALSWDQLEDFARKEDETRHKGNHSHANVSKRKKPPTGTHRPTKQRPRK